MQSDGPLVIALIVFTFAIVLVLLFVQRRKARQARDQHKTSKVGELSERTPTRPDVVPDKQRERNRA